MTMWHHQLLSSPGWRNAEHQHGEIVLWEHEQSLSVHWDLTSSQPQGMLGAMPFITILWCFFCLTPLVKHPVVSFTGMRLFSAPELQPTSFTVVQPARTARRHDPSHLAVAWRWRPVDQIFSFRSFPNYYGTACENRGSMIDDSNHPFQSHLRHHSRSDHEL